MMASAVSIGWWRDWCHTPGARWLRISLSSQKTFGLLGSSLLPLFELPLLQVYFQPPLIKLVRRDRKSTGKSLHGDFRFYQIIRQAANSTNCCRNTTIRETFISSVSPPDGRIKSSNYCNLSQKLMGTAIHRQSRAIVSHFFQIIHSMSLFCRLF